MLQMTHISPFQEIRLQN